jgi:Ca-activated chloride channel family protein
MLRTALLVSALGLSLSAAAEEKVVLVLDASGSMWGQIEGRSKIEIARETVADLVAGWKPQNSLGLVAYGHRRKGDCADIETLIPSATLDSASYLRTVNALNPTGMTPLSAAVIQAAESLRHTEQKATVILVSDGEETCNLDPCQVGRELEAAGVDFTAHVIGFDVSNPQHQAQLRCLAENTGGRYFNARNADELSGALGAMVAVSTEPAPPPASATLEAVDSAPAASNIEVRFTGPGDRGDFIGVYRASATADENELLYAWVEQAEDGRVQLATPATAGAYELRYVSPLRAGAVLAQRPIVISEIEAAIEAPSEAAASSLIQVKVRGPFSPSHWVGFAPKGGDPGSYLDYKRPRGPEDQLELRAPAEPGDYELRFVLNERERVLVSRPFKVVAANVYVRGPAEVAAGSVVEIEADGPIDDRHWIGFAPADGHPGSYRDYTRPVAGQTRYSLRAPGEPGDYELRFVLNESESVAARQAIRVVAAKVQIDAPAEAPAGSPVALTVQGPAGGGTWVGFAPVGSEDGAWEGDYASFESSPLSLQMKAPEAAGAYEIKLVSADGKVLARRAITLR